MIPLSQLKRGSTATVMRIDTDPALGQRLADMGLVPGARVCVIRIAPLGDPMLIGIMGCRLSLRRADAVHILTQPEAMP